MTAHDDPIGTEEPWEAEIGELLGGLPAVDPPDGFIAGAVNHRPLHAGRIMSGLLGLMVVAIGFSVVLRSDRSLVTPQFEALADRHLAAQADLDGDSGGDAAVGDELPMVLPEGYERTATFDTGDTLQSIYTREGEAISVFLQEGKVDWQSLPDDGRTVIAGHEVWVDEEDALVVVQAGDDTLTIVGLGADGVAEVLDSLPPESSSLGDSLRDLASSIVGHLGFPSDHP